MPIPTVCACGAKFAAPSKLAGRQVACPQCKKPVRVVAPKSVSTTGASSAAAKVAANGPQKIPVHCACGYGFKANSELGGKRVACPKCKKPVKIPLAVSSSASTASASKKSDSRERIRAKCSCGYEISAKPELAGRKIACPKCSAGVRLPGEKRPDGHRRVPAAGEKIRFACKCGEAISAKPELAGKKVACPKCKEPVRVPGSNKDSHKSQPENTDKDARRIAGQSKAAGPAKEDEYLASESGFGLSKAGGFGPLDVSLSGLLNEAGFDAVAQSAAKCPSCKAVLADEAVLCVKCGYNVERGKQIKTKKFAGRKDR